MLGITIIIVAILIILFICTSNFFYKEGFDGAMFDSAMTAAIISDVTNNKKIFSSGNYATLKKRFTWIDPILYYDIKYFDRAGLLNPTTLSNYFNYGIRNT